MVSRKKIDLAKILASLNVTCHFCGYSIPPNKIVRLSAEQMVCPQCKASFSTQTVKCSQCDAEYRIDYTPSELGRIENYEKRLRATAQAMINQTINPTGSPDMLRSSTFLESQTEA